MTKYTPKRGDIAEYTFPAGDKHMRPGEHTGQTVIGEVVKVGKTYADVKWSTADRIERIRFADPRSTFAAVVFKSAE